MDPTLTPGTFQANQQVTPQQLANAWESAKELQKQGVNPTIPTNHYSWTQGVNQMLQALVGRGALANANKLQQQYNASQAGAIPGGYTPPYIPPAPRPAIPIQQSQIPPVPFAGAPFSAGGQS